MINVVAGVVFRSKWMTRSFAGSNSITQGAVTQVLRHENEALIGNHRRLMAFCGKEIVDISTWRCLVRKSMDSSGNVDLNDQPRSRRPVTAVHYVNGQKADELFKKNQRIYQTATAEKPKIGVAPVNEIKAGLLTKTMCSPGAVSAYARNDDSKTEKHVSDYSLATKVWVMIFCTALSWGTGVGGVTTTRN